MTGWNDTDNLTGKTVVEGRWMEHFSSPPRTLRVITAARSSDVGGCVHSWQSWHEFKIKVTTCSFSYRKNATFKIIFLWVNDLWWGEWHRFYWHGAPRWFGLEWSNYQTRGTEVCVCQRCQIACSEGEKVPGRQPKLYYPKPGQLGALCQWQECHLPRYKSLLTKLLF